MTKLTRFSLTFYHGIYDLSKKDISPLKNYIHLITPNRFDYLSLDFKVENGKFGNIENFRISLNNHEDIKKFIHSLDTNNDFKITN